MVLKCWGSGFGIFSAGITAYAPRMHEVVGFKDNRKLSSGLSTM